MSLEQLISDRTPSDAVAAYYAWHHPGSRCHLISEPEPAVLIEARSPFGPVAILRTSSEASVPDLLDRVPPGEHYLMAPWELHQVIQEQVTIQKPERNRVFCLPRNHRLWSPATDVPLEEDSVSVTAVLDGQRASRCILLWRSPRFAELSVSTEPEFRGRGLARAVVSRMSEQLQREGITPIYVAGVENIPSLRLAARLGLTSCHPDEFAGTLVV